mmetsp:Transcript_699/g.2347  ORF Transcript_699/g.2347 Transcript_699/m.2347 type:complete len:237 (-) Transcript_699:202-912(-)
MTTAPYNPDISQGLEALRIATYNEIETNAKKEKTNAYSPNNKTKQQQPASSSTAAANSSAGKLGPVSRAFKATRGLSHSNSGTFSFATNSEKETISQKELKRAFASFDRDQSGTIDKDELAAVLKSVGKKVSDKQIDEIMEEIDLDKNGVLDFQEFEYIVQVKLEDNLHDEQSIKELFEFFDRDKDGYISFDELYWVLNKKLKIKISREDVQDMLRYGDLDGNGLLDLEEFSILLS